MDPRALVPVNTAAAIARVRAEEAERPERQRLFEDPFARLFDDVHAGVEQVFGTVPFFREQIRLRTRYFDDRLREALEDGIRTVVLLGAGFDMRAVRLGEVRESNCKVFEVDHASQLEEKTKRLSGAGIHLPSHVHHAPADLMGEPAALQTALRQAGLRNEERVLWIAEGLLGYLSHEAITGLALAAGRLSAPGSVLVANYFTGVLSLPTLVDLLAPGGWSVGAGPTFDALFRRHVGPDVAPGSDAFALLVATR